MDRRLIFEKNSHAAEGGYCGDGCVAPVDPASVLPRDILRADLDFPDVGELGAVRHYSNLTRMSFSVDTNFYPLGSCTMKYNPKINEALAALDGFRAIHPYQDETCVQGALKLIYNLQEMLCKITGMARFTLQPSSGAQGELTGLMMIKAFHQAAGNKKTKVIVPDSAHGTNPATAAMCGYEVVVVASGPDGLVDIEKLEAAVDDTTAAIMLTNPNTLGLFEERILDISRIVHRVGGFLYYDGANLNALLGVTSPRLMGFDVVHLNLHKTFATPHGCGGPGAGAVGAVQALADFLPVPVVDRANNRYYPDYGIKNSIGRMRAFYGNFSVLLRAYCYLLRLGDEGLVRAAHHAVLNANYIKARLKDTYQVPYDRVCMHETVFSCLQQKEKGAGAMDIAKALIDYGIHPPTIYFPLIVKEALMVEPTETESKAVLDEFISALLQIDQDIGFDPDKVKIAPQTTPVRRVDETYAARFPDLRWQKPGT